jgi:hypothetical protein
VSSSSSNEDGGAHDDYLSNGKRLLLERPSTSTAHQKSTSDAPEDGARDDSKHKEINESSPASTEQKQKSTQVLPTKQVYTAPTPSETNPMHSSGPYNPRDMWTRRVTRPFDEDDDGSENYMSKTEEEIYFHRGVLLHYYLHHFKKDSKNDAEQQKEKQQQQVDDEKKHRESGGTSSSKEIPPKKFWYYTLYNPDRMYVQYDRFSSDNPYTQALLRLNLINVVCRNDFQIEEVRSNQHKVPCADCGKGFRLYNNPTLYAMDSTKYGPRVKICMECVKFRSDLILRLTNDKLSFRQIHQIKLVVGGPERDMRLLHLCLTKADNVFDMQRKKLENVYGVGGLFDKGLSDEPIRLNLNYGGISMTSRELLEEDNVSFHDIMSSNIPICKYCSGGCKGCKNSWSKSK